MTECSTCGLRFSGTSAFDAHRVGRHAYTFTQGLALEPPVEDGRRCLDLDELRRAGMELDPRGRWRVVASEKQLAGLARIREKAPTDAQEALPALGGTPGRTAA